MAHEDKERFIPFTKAELVELLLQHQLTPQQQTQFKALGQILQSIYHFQFHQQLESLKDNYFPFNPDQDTQSKRSYSPQQLKQAEQNLVDEFQTILNAANYSPITEQQLKHAMQAESPFQLSLQVDLQDFSHYVLFSRGEGRKKMTRRKWLFKQEEIEVPIYQRIVLLLKYQGEGYFKQKKRKNLDFVPGHMMIKLFKEIPKADIDMLFPNVQIQMTLKDKLLIGGMGLFGGVGVLLKTGAGLVAMFSVAWFIMTSWATQSALPTLSASQITAMAGGVVAIGVILAFLWKQWTNYAYRRIRFMKQLADNLYFKNLDNNIGVFHHLIDSAEEEECKEALLAYHFLLRSDQGLTAKTLDNSIEKWFAQTHDIELDFEVDDALRKLTALELCRESGKNPDGETIYQALNLEAACTRLDYIWDNYFQYNS